MLPLVRVGASAVRPDVIGSWLEDARLVEKAHRVTVAWLRSRLPSYPRLPAPQLATGTPLTTNEFTYRLQWTRAELAAGLQFQNPPTKPLDALGANERDAARAHEAARRLVLALGETAQWQRLHAADAALSLDDRSELAAMRKAIAEALTPTVVGAHEPDLAIPRNAYRQQVLEHAMGALTGPAREYADAFDTADRLIELACSDVFGQLAVYGTVALNGVTELAAHGAGPGSITFTVEDTMYMNAGAVAWLDDPLIADAVHVTAIDHSFNQARGMRVRATGQALVGTAAAWARPGL